MSTKEPASVEEPESLDRAIVSMAQASIDRVLQEPPQELTDDDPLDDCQLLDALAELLGSKLPDSSENTFADQKRRGISDDARHGGDAFSEDARLGRFRLIRQLGHGGFGVVVLAFDPRLQREVALKLPRPELLALGKWRKQFFHEARSAASLDHPGIVPVFDIGSVGPVWYIASAYCNGPTLAQWRRNKGPVSARIAAELMAPVADALQHAHSRGILHRDLKPANILLKLPLNSDSAALPTPQVTDFGLASRKRLTGEWATKSGLVGTLPYMAPEQTFDDQPQVGTAADVYALGAILFELLTDRPPFTAQDEKAIIEQIRHEPAPTLRRIRPDTHRDLEAVCAKCLAKEPTERYESAAGLARDLRRFLAGDCIDARPLGPLNRTIRWCKRRPATATLAAALLLAVVCGGAVSLRQWQRAEENLQQAEAAVVNLGWAIDDAVFWHNDNDRYGPEQRQELTRRYAALLEQLSDRPAAKPVRAAADCFFARLDVLDGKPDKAREKFGRSISEWHDLVRNDPGDMFNRRTLAKTLYCYGTFLLTVENVADGMSHFDGDRLFGRFEADGGGQAAMQDYADILFEKAESLRQRDIDLAAATHYAACMEVCRRLTAANPADADAQFRILQSQMRLGLVHRPAASREGMYAMRMEALEGIRALVRQFPARHEYRIEHANAALWIARHAEKLGHKEVVEEFLAEAVDSFERALVAADCPLEVKHKYADALRFKALRHVDMNQFTEAKECAQAALKWYDGVGPESANREHPLAAAYHSVGGIYLQCGADDEALETLERASELYESALRGAPRNRGVHLQHADVWAKLSALYERSGRKTEALEASKEALCALEGWRGPTPAEPHVALALRRLRSNVSRLQAADEERL